jgi:ribosomal protein L37AE/L43A
MCQINQYNELCPFGIMMSLCQERTMIGKDMEELHNCEKCKGKIVCITIDKLGITRCAYCHQQVNYLKRK